MSIWAKIYTFIINNNLIMLLLAIDTCRAFIATWGIVPRHWPFIGRAIYGKRDEDLVRSVLLQLGYKDQQVKKIFEQFKPRRTEGPIKIRNYPGYLLNILSQYTDEFQTEISYGTMAQDKKTSYSRYYISTMDAVHDDDGLKYLTIIMAKLIKKHHRGSLDYIIVPKGGNPILAQSVASQLGIDLIIAKDQNDSARPPQKGDNFDERLLFQIRYEGVKKVLESEKKKTGILLDCNTSGGTQLRSIVIEFNDFLAKTQNKNVAPIKDVFVLFKLAKENENKTKFEESFSEIGCKLYRFFDLDENDKAALIHIPKDDYYANADNLDNILGNIKAKGNLYYE